jgi:LPS export ABC transporter protein LptC
MKKYLYIITILLFSCENDIHRVQDLGKHHVGIEEGKNIESYLSQGGVVRAKLTALTMLRQLTDTVKVEFTNGLHVLFYDSVTNVESQLFAKYGNYYENNNKVFLRDSVKVFNVKHDTLWCKELYWDQNRSIFYTDKPIKISQQNPHQIIYGLGLRADQNFKWFTINHIGKIYTGYENFIDAPENGF